MGENVGNYVLDILNNGSDINSINHTHCANSKKETMSIYQRLSAY